MWARTRTLFWRNFGLWETSSTSTKVLLDSSFNTHFSCVEEDLFAAWFVSFTRCTPHWHLLLLMFNWFVAPFPVYCRFQTVLSPWDWLLLDHLTESWVELLCSSLLKSASPLSIRWCFWIGAALIILVKINRFLKLCADTSANSRWDYRFFASALFLGTWPKWSFLIFYYESAFMTGAIRIESLFARDLLCLHNNVFLRFR